MAARHAKNRKSKGRQPKSESTTQRPALGHTHGLFAVLTSSPFVRSNDGQFIEFRPLEDVLKEIEAEARKVLSALPPYKIQFRQERPKTNSISEPIDAKSIDFPYRVPADASMVARAASNAMQAILFLRMSRVRGDLESSLLSAIQLGYEAAMLVLPELHFSLGLSPAKLPIAALLQRHETQRQSLLKSRESRKAKSEQRRLDLRAAVLKKIDEAKPSELTFTNACKVVAKARGIKWMNVYRAARNEK